MPKSFLGAEDIHRLLREHLQVKGPVALVGHDIGFMIAYAYAQAYRKEISHLVIIDAPLPGTTVFDRLKSGPRLWHFAFHQARDIAENAGSWTGRALLAGFFLWAELQSFGHRSRRVRVNLFGPGAMRAGFELYREFEQDGADNRDFLRQNGKLTIPVLAVAGAISNSGPLLEEMMPEVASNVKAVRVEETATGFPKNNRKSTLSTFNCGAGFSLLRTAVYEEAEGETRLSGEFQSGNRSALDLCSMPTRVHS